MSAAPASAHPPNRTDHGVDSETFHALWSGDRDAFVVHTTGREQTAMQELANGTDIPLDSPPAAVEDWNAGDLREFPNTDTDTSIHPPDANLQDGRFIKDAYTELFAVQPSTRARITPSMQPLYVASNGSVLGTVDYRIELPPDDRTGNRRVYWSISTHRINETRVRVDGQVIANASGSHTPTIPYANLDTVAGQTHTLALEAEVFVRVQKRIEVCVARANGDCIRWSIRFEYLTEQVTVDDTIEVVEYDLSISGFRARYPNGDLGLVVYKNHPWLGYTLPNGDVRGVWRFYTARDTDWDTLVRSTEATDTEAHSPLHPLQVNAYPIETGPTPSPRVTVDLLEPYGTTLDPPALPAAVHLDVLTDPYTASYGIATRTQTSNHDLSALHAQGLVHGVRVRAHERYFATVPIHRSNLTLTILNRTAEKVTVQVRLQDANTSAPINTVDREGYVVLAGERTNTSGDGTVTRTLSRPSGGISARYEPGAWWRNLPGYTGDSARVLVRGTVLQIVDALYQLGVPISLFLLGVFIIDRFTGWGAWPPWRNL